MSDDPPEITVTRGKRHERSERSRTSSPATRSPSSGLGLPGLGTVVSGAIRSVHNVWRAGLGVVAVARDAGTQVFDALVEEGKSWEQAQRERRQRTSQQMRRMSEGGGAANAIEERVRDEVSEVLRRIGGPDRDRIDALRDRIDALDVKIARLREAVFEAQREREP